MKEALISLIGVPLGIIYSLIMLVISAVTGVGSSDAQVPTDKGAYLHIVDGAGVGRSGCTGLGWATFEGHVSSNAAGYLKMLHAERGTYDVEVSCAARLTEMGSSDRERVKVTVTVTGEGVEIFPVTVPRF